MIRFRMIEDRKKEDRKKENRKMKTFDLPRDLERRSFVKIRAHRIESSVFVGGYCLVC